MLIAEGAMLTLETGQYSDFTYVGPFRACRTFEQKEAIDAFLEQWPADRTRRNTEAGYALYDDDDGPGPDDFIAFLSRAGYIEDVPCSSWHVGSYGRFDAVSA